MDTSFRLLPARASTQAQYVDALYFYLLITSAAMIALIAALILWFSIKYRKGSAADRSPPNKTYQIAMETFYISAPFLVFGTFFFWGAVLFFADARPPDGALEIQVVGKQWMWKLQHSSGRREINELHVPLGRPMRLQMISQDVIHSFFVPAFRIKQDVLPGRYVQAWFEASALGEYHLFCAEYCGTNHSRMIGRVIVMEPAQYAAWLSGDAKQESPTARGERLFQELRCATCHRGNNPRGPALENLAGAQVRLQNGTTATATDDYLREAILHSASKIVAGYQPIMPSFEGLIDEEGVLDLIAYLKSRTTPRGANP